MKQKDLAKLAEKGELVTYNPGKRNHPTPALIEALGKDGVRPWAMDSATELSYWEKRKLWTRGAVLIMVCPPSLSPDWRTVFNRFKQPPLEDEAAWEELAAKVEAAAMESLTDPAEWSLKPTITRHLTRPWAGTIAEHVMHYRASETRRLDARRHHDKMWDKKIMPFYRRLEAAGVPANMVVRIGYFDEIDSYDHPDFRDRQSLFHASGDVFSKEERLMNIASILLDKLEGKEG